LHPDVKIAELAERQHSVVTRRQLTSAGISRHAIDHRLAVRRLRAVHSGVYAVGPLRLEGIYLAAVLACGDRALLSHRAAAALWDLRPAPSGPVEITVPRRRTVRHRSGIAIHTTRCLEPEDVAEHCGIPCTSVARTLVDLAVIVTPRVLDRAIERSMVLRLYDHRAMMAALERANGRRGSGVLRRSIANLTAEPPNTRSELERRIFELTRDSGLPRPLVNIRVAGYEVDFCWPQQRVVVEADGRRTHDTPQAFERDRQRDLDLELAGFHVIRITWRQLIDRPEQIVATLRTRLAGGGSAVPGVSPL
jgi:very-short-patch-repair endonuclease